MWHDASLSGADFDTPNQHVVPNHFFPPSTQSWRFPLPYRDPRFPPFSHHFPSLPIPPRAQSPAGRQRHNSQPQSPPGWPSQTMPPLPDIDNIHVSFASTPSPPRALAPTSRSVPYGSSSGSSILTRYHPYRSPQAEEAPYSQFGSAHEAVHSGAPRFPHPLHTLFSPLPYPTRALTRGASSSSLSSPQKAWSLHRQTQLSPITASYEFNNSTAPNSFPPHTSHTSEGLPGLFTAAAAATAMTVTVSAVAPSRSSLSAPTKAQPHPDQTSPSSSASKQRRTHTRCNRGCLTCRARHKVR